MVEHRPFKAGVAGSSPARLICGPFVYRLGHRVFNPVRGVRFSYGLHLPFLSFNPNFSINRNSSGEYRRCKWNTWFFLMVCKKRFLICNIRTSPFGFRPVRIVKVQFKHYFSCLLSFSMSFKKRLYVSISCESGNFSMSLL